MDNQRPQFRNYPLKSQQIRQIYQQNASLDKQIRDNDNQIRILNGKIAKTDYEYQLLSKLKNKQRILQEKKRQLNQIVQTQKYIQDQIKVKKMIEGEVKNNLANQYKQAMEQKRLRSQLQRKKQMQQQRAFQSYNSSAMEQETKRRKQQAQQFKKQVQQQLLSKQLIKQRQKMEQLKQKNEYNEKTRMLGIMQTQKQSNYKQYYQQFIDQQNKIGNLYENRAGNIDNSREIDRSELVKKGIQEATIKNSRQYADKLNKIVKDKQQLRSALQRQIQQKQHRKLLQKNEHKKLVQMSQMHNYENNIISQLQKQKRKQQQRKYDENLANQIKLKQTMYTNLNNQQSNTPRSHPVHNPITNPIDFKIGITNPYVVQTYENTKQRYLNQNGLKLRNLAMIGNNSLGKWNVQH